MYTSFNTATWAADEWQARWRHAIGETYFPLALELDARRHYRGELKHWTLGALELSWLSSSATRFVRLQQQIRDDEEPSYLVTLPVAGRADFAQGGHHLSCHPDAFILERSDLPYEFSYGRESAFWVLKLPERLLSMRLGQPEHYLYSPLDCSQGMGAMLHALLDSFRHQSARVPPQAAAALGGQIVELLVLTLMHAPGLAKGGAFRAGRMHMRNIERYVRAHLGSGELGPEQIASACNISTRYLHQLFRQSGQTVGQWIRELRLQGAWQDIQAQTASVTLAEIAYRWGFNDQSHFCRQFRSRFGCTPGAARRQILS